MKLPDEWPRVRPWIEAALERAPGLETIEDVDRFLESGKYLLFTSPNAAMVAQIIEYERKKAIHAIHGGGNLKELIDVIEPRMRACGKVNGCSLSMGMGRKGWERALKDKGYRLGWVTMIKDIA